MHLFFLNKRWPNIVISNNALSIVTNLYEYSNVPTLRRISRSQFHNKHLQRPNCLTFEHRYFRNYYEVVIAHRIQQWRNRTDPQQNHQRDRSQEEWQRAIWWPSMGRIAFSSSENKAATTHNLSRTNGFYSQTDWPTSSTSPGSKSKGIICILDKCHQAPFQPLHHRYSRHPVVVALALDQRWPMVRGVAMAKSRQTHPLHHRSDFSALYRLDGPHHRHL